MNRTGASQGLPASSSLESDRWLTWIAMGLLLVILAFFMLYPVFDITKLSFFRSGTFTLKNYVSYFTNPRMFRSLTNSLYVSVVTMTITTVLAFFFAYGLTRTTIRGKGLFYTISTFPLIAPSIIQGLALILLFGRNGLITRYLLHTDWNIYGATGIIVAECLYCFPNALFILYTTLSAVDTRLDEAAQSLGASALKTFYKVTLPSAKYGIASAAALVFNLTITDFGVPVVIGGNYSVLATEIYQQVIGMQRFDLGATISVILLIPSVGAFLLNYYLTKKSYALISGQARPFLQPSRPFKKWAFTLYCWIPCLFILTVFATVFMGSLVKTWPYDFSLTFKHYDFPSLGGSGPLWTPFWTSVLKGEWQPITEVAAITDGQTAKKSLDEIAAIALRFRGGAIGTVCCGRRVPDTRNDAVIYGTGGRVLLQDTVWEPMRGKLEVMSDTVNMEEPYEGDLLSLYRLQIESFQRAVQGGEQFDASGMDGVRAVQVASAIIESASTGRTVRIEPL